MIKRLRSLFKSYLKNKGYTIIHESMLESFVTERFRQIFPRESREAREAERVLDILQDNEIMHLYRKSSFHYGKVRMPFCLL